MKNYWWLLVFFFLRVSFVRDYLPLCTGYRKREGSMFLISYCTISTIFELDGWLESCSCWEDELFRKVIELADS